MLLKNLKSYIYKTCSIVYIFRINVSRSWRNYLLSNLRLLQGRTKILGNFFLRGILCQRSTSSVSDGWNVYTLVESPEKKFILFFIYLLAICNTLNQIIYHYIIGSFFPYFGKITNALFNFCWNQLYWGNITFGNQI